MDEQTEQNYQRAAKLNQRPQAWVWWVLSAVLMLAVCVVGLLATAWVVR